MQDILPEPVLMVLRQHYYAGVTAAEIGYEYNAADEDSVTGALGQALLMPLFSTISSDGRAYSLRAWHHKLGGRGKGAPERKFGADGVFQLEVLGESGNVVRRKALLFQAKKEWKGTDRRLLQQVEAMTTYSSSAIVVDYSRSGFSGVSAGEVIEAGGNRRAIRAGSAIRLAEFLGDEFVYCRRGEVGLFWNPETKSLESDLGVLPAPRHVKSTVVQRVQ